MADKSKIKELLEGRDIAGVSALAGNSSRALSSLIPYVYEKNDLMRGRAFEAMAAVAAAMAGAGLEDIRNIVRRLLWSMDDESGCFGLYAAEAAGWIIASVSRLIPEYGALIASHIEREQFQESALRAVSMMARVAPDVFSGIEDVLLKFISSRSPAERAFAADAMISIFPGRVGKIAGELSGDMEQFSVYDMETGRPAMIAVCDFVNARMMSEFS